MTVRSRIAMLMAEFLGTAVLATVLINVSRSQIGIGYFVAIAAGGALALLVLALGAASGGHFNPIITIGLWTLRRIQTVQAIAYLAVQMLGGFAAWHLANYFNHGEITSYTNGVFDWRVLIAEALGALVFTFAVAAAVYQRYEGGKAAALIGGGFFLGILVAMGTGSAPGSAGILNPAIALANQSWSRAYIFGPIIGSVIGMNLYVLLFAPAKALVTSTVSNKTVSSGDDATVTAKAKTTSVAAKAKKTVKRKAASRKKK